MGCRAALAATGESCLAKGVKPWRQGVALLDAISLRDLVHPPFVVGPQVCGGTRVHGAGERHERRDCATQFGKHGRAADGVGAHRRRETAAQELNSSGPALTGPRAPTSSLSPPAAMKAATQEPPLDWVLELAARPSMLPLRPWA